MEGILKTIRYIVPPLSQALHKGQMGRIGVVGGSKEYSGAPYFAGITALSCGADLVHIICASSAAQAIKCYSPELIVHPSLDTDIDESMFWVNKAHSLVIGPGLGRSANEFAVKIMNLARSNNSPLVVDADGLYVVSQNLETVRNYKLTILTPNVNEFNLLYKTVFQAEPSDDPQETAKLARQLEGVTIVRKGLSDIISDGDQLIIYNFEGSPRRCGGQGDLLSGAAAVFSFWFANTKIDSPYSSTMLAATAACMLTRRCAKRAFEKYGRCTMTNKMIEEIGPAFDELFIA
nr:serine:threonine protein kinase RIO1 [Hymenolepis microstoma]